MRLTSDTLSRTAGTAAGAVTGVAILTAVLVATAGRWALPSDRWHQFAAWLGLPPGADPVLVAGWCAAGGALIALAIRAATRVAAALGLPPWPALATAAMVVLNPAGLRAAFIYPWAGFAALIALRLAARRLAGRRKPRRHSAPSRRPPTRVRLAAAIGVTWLAFGVTGVWREAGRIAGEARRVLAVPRPVPGAPAADPAIPRLPGWNVVDMLNVADAAAERAHDYRLGGNAVLSIVTLPDPVARRPVADAGRETGGRESFRLAGQRDRPVVLLARLRAPAGGGLRVIWNGVPLPPVRLSADPERFQTIIIGHDRGQLVGSVNRVVVVRTGDNRIGSFAYWLLQPAR